MGEQNLKLKWKLVIQSFLPLFILIFIKYSDYRMISAMCQFKSMQMSGFVDAGEKFVIEEEITDSGITFFMTFVLSLLPDDVETLKGFIIFTGILGLFIRLMWTTHLYYQNPILTLLGYRIYKFHFINPVIDGCKDKTMIAVCKTGIAEEKIVKWKYISDDVCLMYNKN